MSKRWQIRRPDGTTVWAMADDYEIEDGALTLIDSRGPFDAAAVIIYAPGQWVCAYPGASDTE